MSAVNFFRIGFWELVISTFWDNLTLFLMGFGYRLFSMGFGYSLFSMGEILPPPYKSHLKTMIEAKIWWLSRLNIVDYKNIPKNNGSSKKKNAFAEPCQPWITTL